MEFALTGKNGLFEFLGLFDNPGRILLMHAGEDAHEFLSVALSNRSDGTAIFGFGVTDEIKAIVAVLGVERIACANIFELNSSTNVTGTKLID